MRLTFISTSAEVDPPINVTVEEPTLLQCLAKIEITLIALLGGPVDLADDAAFNLNDCNEALQEGKTYFRADFSSSEENFSLIENWNPANSSAV